MVRQGAPRSLLDIEPDLDGLRAVFGGRVENAFDACVDVVGERQLIAAPQVGLFMSVVDDGLGITVEAERAGFRRPIQERGATIRPRRRKTAMVFADRPHPLARGA